MKLIPEATCVPPVGASHHETGSIAEALNTTDPGPQRDASTPVGVPTVVMFAVTATRGLGQALTASA